MDEHTLNDLLECSVCLERLDTSSKVLPCQHTFCRKCLEVIVSSHQELRCPECRVLVDVKIDDLPPNVLLMRILEGMKNAAATKTQQQIMQQIETNRLKSNNKQIDCKHQQQILLQQKHKTNEQLQHLQQQLQYHQQQYQQQKKSETQYQQQTPSVTVPTETTLPTQHQPRRSLLPHAYAMHDFESSETSDLNFKKGDLLLLKRKIDDNWYVGQANGVEGTFPINYVKVIVPLPTPQCIALYDFKMGPNEEEGCLSFKKGAIIHVLRRVDHNWAEGRIGGTIGIFPIAFVRMNTLAEQMLDINQQQRQQINTTITTAMLNATVTNTQTTTITSTASTASTTTTTVNTTCSNSNYQNSSSLNNSSSNSSSSNNTTSSENSPSHSQENTQQHMQNTNNVVVAPTTTTTTNSDEIILAAGVSGLDCVQLRYREGREKRHSLNALLNSSCCAAKASNIESSTAPTATNISKNIIQTNRHSAEILSMPHESTIAEQHHPTNNMLAVPQTSVAREQQQQQQQTRVNVLKSPVVVQQQMVPPSLPWGYLALYPYKPRKNDELELKKGCVYIVTERCLDGWFKGKNWQDTMGVFPGNYVTPLRPRDQKQLMHQWKHVPLVSMAPMTNITTTTAINATANIAAASSSATTTTTTIRNGHNILPILQIPPPDAPPRREASVSPCASPSASTTTCASVWTKPLGHTVEAFFNRNTVAGNNNNKIIDKCKDKENVNCTVTSTTSSVVASNSASSSTTTNAAVSLMKRLTSMKSRSKSPAATTNTEETTVPLTRIVTSSQQQQHPVHVRSGSCPSQLLQNLPKDRMSAQQKQPQTQANSENIFYKHEQHQQQQQQQQVLPGQTSNISYGSQRLKGCKERPPLQNARQSLDASLFRNTYYPVTTQHHQQQQQQQQFYNTQATSQSFQNINHRKSQSLDANSILMANTVGVMSHPVPPPMPTANVVKNAKSTQNMHESRFRCIVPYPPNSDFELELHVGDIIYVQRKAKNGWYKGTCTRNNKTGLFPASFVEPDI